MQLNLLSGSILRTVLRAFSLNVDRLRRVLVVTSDEAEVLRVQRMGSTAQNCNRLALNRVHLFLAIAEIVLRANARERGRMAKGLLQMLLFVEVLRSRMCQTEFACVFSGLVDLISVFLDYDRVIAQVHLHVAFVTVFLAGGTLGRLLGLRVTRLALTARIKLVLLVLLAIFDLREVAVDEVHRLKKATLLQSFGHFRTLFGPTRNQLLVKVTMRLLQLVFVE